MVLFLLSFLVSIVILITGLLINNRIYKKHDISMFGTIRDGFCYDAMFMCVLLLVFMGSLLLIPVLNIIIALAFDLVLLFHGVE